MARSKQNGIAPDDGGNLSGKAGAVVEPGGKKASAGKKAGKSTSKKKQKSNNINGKKSEDIQDGVVGEGEGSISSKVEAVAVNNRDILREEVMTQVWRFCLSLQLFKDKRATASIKHTTNKCTSQSSNNIHFWLMRPHVIYLRPLKVEARS